MFKPSPSDPKHVPDIVSGHTSSIFDPNQNAASSNLMADHSMTSKIDPPSRPPRKSKKQYTSNERNEIHAEVSVVYCAIFVLYIYVRKQIYVELNRMRRIRIIFILHLLVNTSTV